MKRTQQPPALSPSTRRDMRLAARVISQGHSETIAAARVFTTSKRLRQWQECFPDEWAAFLAHHNAMREVQREAAKRRWNRVALLEEPTPPKPKIDRRRAAAIVDNPPPEVTVADPSLHTVPTFLDSYVIPCCLTEAAPATVNAYRIVVRKFAKWAGNPPLKAITNVMLAQYREAMKKMPARAKGDKPLSINTVASQLGMLQTILDRAGSPVRRCRDAAGILETVPWVKLPREVLGEVAIVSDEAIAACYAKAETMRRPAENPGDFWRAVLVVGRHLGLRSRTLFGMHWRDVEWNHKRIRLPASIMKAKKMLVLPMPKLSSSIWHHSAVMRGRCSIGRTTNMTTDNETAGHLSLDNGSHSVKLHFVDPGFIPAQITVSGWGVELEQVKPDK